MYASNVFSKRRADGWSERRRHFQRLFEQVRNKEAKPDGASRDDSEAPKK